MVSTKSKKKNNKTITVKEIKQEPGEEKVKNTSKCSFHYFEENDVPRIQSNLLDWYDKNQRILPWREIAKTEVEDNIRGYSVWVSEIMLQQTQVATVVDYFNRWMKEWPTIEDLSKAKLEEVNKVWAGLGYYSRAKRLLEGAQKIVNELNGEMPQNSKLLLDSLPGVGRYTSSAIASIAYKEPVGVVDGNVSRVLSRLRLIGADITKPTATDTFWNLANKLVDLKRPGDFNQAVMELGATLCTPKNPSCERCPLQDCCRAYKHNKEQIKSKPSKLLKKEVKLQDIEDIS